ncbi:hypothetical protein ACR9GP_26915 [Enterobacter ludwigii]
MYNYVRKTPQDSGESESTETRPENVSSSGLPKKKNKQNSKNASSKEKPEEDIDAILQELATLAPIKHEGYIDEGAAGREDAPLMDPAKFNVKYPDISHEYFNEILDRAKLRRREINEMKSMTILQRKSLAQRVEFVYKSASKTLSLNGGFRIINELFNRISLIFSGVEESLSIKPAVFAEKILKNHAIEIKETSDLYVNEKARVFRILDEMIEMQSPDQLDVFNGAAGIADDEFTKRLFFYLENPSAERFAYLFTDDRELPGGGTVFDRFKMRLIKLNDDLNNIQSSAGWGNIEDTEKIRIIDECRNMMTVDFFVKKIRLELSDAFSADKRMSSEIQFLNPDIFSVFERGGALNNLLDNIAETVGIEQIYSIILDESLEEGNFEYFREMFKVYHAKLMLNSLGAENIKNEIKYVLGDETISLYSQYAHAAIELANNGIDILNDIFILKDYNSKAGVAELMLTEYRDKLGKTFTDEEVAQWLTAYCNLQEHTEINEVVCSKFHIAELIDYIVNMFEEVGFELSPGEKSDFMACYFYNRMTSFLDITSDLITGESCDLNNLIHLLSVYHAFYDVYERDTKQYPQIAGTIRDMQDNIFGAIEKKLKSENSKKESATSDEFSIPSEPAKKNRNRKNRKSRTSHQSESRQFSSTPADESETQIDSRPVVTEKTKSERAETLVATQEALPAHPKADIMSNALQKTFFHELYVQQREFHESGSSSVNAASKMWATREAALVLGRKWVGIGFRRTTSGTYISADGLRRFRVPKEKGISSLGLSPLQANFEERNSLKENYFKFNFHLNVTDSPVNYILNSKKYGGAPLLTTGSMDF